ncbi:ATP-binding protein [Streptomyces sp. NPDC008313]|uniref:ATP-binding protein n=1 Tax=Streptomyces sp. NPDC008313 TaxID=3364826 RepID=UPI0036E53CA6
MEEASAGDGRVPAADSVSAEFHGVPGDIAQARELARRFLARVWSVHGTRVSEQAGGTVQLVVSELMTNACKYAPGPYLLDLRLGPGTVTVSVWDSEPVMPVARAADPGRVGQHGLEIVMAVCQSFEVRLQPSGKRTTARIGLTGAVLPGSGGRAPAARESAGQRS